MSKPRSKAQAKRPKRVTIAHARRRMDLAEWETRERERYPDAHIAITGEQGSWKLRRDKQSGDPERMFIAHLGDWA